MKRYRIVNKLRFTTFMTAFVLLAIVCFSSVLGYNDVSASDNKQYEEYFVQAGDTLWDIASQFKPSDINIKKFIYEIQIHNNTDAEHLQAGQTIEIPIYD